MPTCDSVMRPLLTVEREGFKLTGAPIAPHAFEAAPGGFITKSPIAAYWFIHYADFRAERVLRRAKEVFEASKSLSCEKSLRRHPLGFSYFPYQVAGIDFMQKHKRCLNADAPGTGKTIQIAGLINETDVKRVLVLCPASLRLNWLYEIHKWVFRELEALEVVSYDSAWRKSYFKKLLDFQPDLVVMDEAHYLKNAESKRSMAARSLSSGVDRVVLLTGTPVMNRPKDVFMLLQILKPNMFPDFMSFVLRYCGAFLQEIRKYDHRLGRYTTKKVWNTDGASNTEELRDILRSTLMIRRLKVDVLPQLPKKLRQLIVIPSDGVKSVSEEKVKWAEMCYTLGYEKALKQLEQGVGVVFDAMASVRRRVALDKVPYVVEHVQNLLLSEEKVVVFAHHKAVVEALMDGFFDYGPVRFVGGMSEKAKDASVKAFQSNSKSRVFVGNILAAGVGITLTAASTVVFAELAFVPSQMSQAEDRCCRIGASAGSVLVQHVVLDGSMDVHVARMLLKKQEVADSILDV